MRIALVHDWLTGYRGGERVLEHLARRFPDADLYTLFHEPGSVPAPIERLALETSPLDRLRFARRHYRKLLPFHPWAIRQFDLGGHDLILSTSHAFAKSVRVPPAIPHLSYCFTPMRYVWDQTDEYLGRGVKRALALPLAAALRSFDRRSSGPTSVTRFVAVSGGLTYESPCGCWGLRVGASQEADRERYEIGRKRDPVTNKRNGGVVFPITDFLFSIDLHPPNGVRRYTTAPGGS